MLRSFSLFCCSATSEVSWFQPVITDAGVFGGNRLAVLADSDTYGVAWGPFSGTLSYHSYGYTSDNSGFPHWYSWYTPEAIKISNITITNSDSNYCIGSYKVYGSTNNSNYVELCSGTNSNNTKGSAWNISVNSTQFYNYHKIIVSSHVSGSGNTVRFGLINIAAKYKPDSIVIEDIWTSNYEHKYYISY